MASNADIEQKAKQASRWSLSGIFNWNSINPHKVFEKDVDGVFEILEEEYGQAPVKDMSLEEFQVFARGKTRQWQKQVQNGEVELNDIEREVYALVLETARRLMGMEPRRVQVTCAFVLDEKAIAEMKTGEGKTLVSTMPVYLNALTGKGVHVMTVNDYLADRDASWMGKIHEFLGLSVGCVTQGLNDDQRREQYSCDITYGTNEQFGFDYLRDNMKISKKDMVQRGHAFAIVDEADSIMIDEARTPLIISGPTADLSDLYMAIDAVIPLLQPEDYEVDEKKRLVTFTESGQVLVENYLKEKGYLEDYNLHDAEGAPFVHHLTQALKAHKLFEKDRDYVVHGDKVIIVNRSTGRLQPGQRYSDGLHQAIEAKEKVAVQPENETLASITRQNYLRLYDKLAGMTGTAMTEAEEFMDIYGLAVMEIDSHKPIARVDESDEVYLTLEEKLEAIVEEIREAHAKDQPVLVGAASVEKSEFLSQLLTQHGIKHNLLNARNHALEAQIIAEAGVPGAVTIATNMAGRGTDIKLGGNEEMRIEQETAGMEAGPEREAKIAEIKADVTAKKQQAMDAGGLYVIGTERHESRRIDNQLRGRAGRQGEPGRSKFFLSLEDDLMRIFGGEGLKRRLQFIGAKRGEAVIHSWVNKAIANAQRKVENQNFERRKNIIKYDDVMNDQRKVVLEDRKAIMELDDVSDILREFRCDIIANLVSAHIPKNSYPDFWNMEGLGKDLKSILGLDVPVESWADEEGVEETEILRRLVLMSDMDAARNDARFGSEVMRGIEKMALLQAFDLMWREHTRQLDHIKTTIGLRAYAQRDPLQEYKLEGFRAFEEMQDNIRKIATQQISNLMIRPVQTEQPALRGRLQSSLLPIKMS